ncbi:BppU family phage baseplate upper protein [Fructobacillus durionis]|uniref:BppU N-terminal domain-containing protein n=1 Tax=Fructobacillus durionis TaxID=283737 RepID=A0A1I1HNV2_9LACO|nr:BppU family phage baseplate upper protein [Fructobacillus durionis]SFC25242.1 hypothetical protein SAMN05660453_0056 [Fructobacillus durionis]
MSKAINLALDTTKSDINNPTYKLRQGDGNYQTIRATITANGEPFDLTDVSVSFNGTTAANTKVIDYNVVKIDILQGLIEYTPNKQMGSSVGRYKEAYFRFTKDDSTATTASFNVDVITSVDITNEDAKDYVSIVDETIKKLNDATKEQLDNSSKLINGEFDNLSERIKQVTDDFNDKANKATELVNDVSLEIDNKLTDAKKRIDELNKELDDIKANEPNYAKLNADNNFKGNNTFEKPIKASGGVVGNVTGNLQGNATTSSQSITSKISEKANVADVANAVAEGLDIKAGKVIANDEMMTKKGIYTSVKCQKDGMTLWLNRVGNIVTILIDDFMNISWELADNEVIANNIPAGYRPNSYSKIPIYLGDNGSLSSISPSGVLSNGTRHFYSNGDNYLRSLKLFGTYMTVDDFPS